MRAMEQIRRNVLVGLVLCLTTLYASAVEPVEEYELDHVVTTNASINCIFQDRDGVVWYGTRSGLYRYMGSASAMGEVLFSGENIDDIQQDSEGVLWVSRHSQYVAYDPRTRSVVEPSQMGEQPILKMAVDEDGGRWWINDEGLWLSLPRMGQTPIYVDSVESSDAIYDIKSHKRVLYMLYRTGEVRRYAYDVAGRTIRRASIPSPDSESDAPYSLIFIDSRDAVWLSQGNRGVWHLPSGADDYVLYTAEQVDRRILPGTVHSIVEDNRGSVWIASDHGGITLCHAGGGMSYLKNDPTNRNTLVSDNVTALSRDAEGNVWVGYNKRGISLWRSEQRAYTINHLRELKRRNLASDINCTAESGDGVLWFGTDGYGLFSFDPATGAEQCYTRENSALGSDVITTILFSRDGRMWVGTYYGGMTCYMDGELRTYRHDDYDQSTLSHNDVWALHEDDRGRIWIGTLGGGVDLLDEGSGSFIRLNTESGLSNDYVMQLASHGDRLYVATAHGFNVVNIATGVPVVEEILFFEGSLIGVIVDSHGMVWLNCLRKVVMYDPTTRRHYDFDRFDGNNIHSIIEGEEGSVWCVTDRALYMLRVANVDNHGEYTFRRDCFRFSSTDDVQFNERSVSRLASGEMLIGSFDGYVRVASSIANHDEECCRPKLCFTRLEIDNMAVEVGKRYDGHMLLDRAMEYTDHLELFHHENTFTVYYSCLDYSSSLGYDLKYRLLGTSDEWMPLGDQSQKITLYNLSPGEYRLQLAIDTGHGTIEPGCTLLITVRPPWWLSRAAIVVYIILFLVLVYAIIRLVRRIARRRMELRQRAIREEHRHYVEQMKMQFFTNVSHDFRTPLTLIISPLEEMLGNASVPRDDESLGTVYRNAKRLLTLVNQLLDLRKLDAMGMKLSLSHGDLAQSVMEVSESFKLLSKNSGVKLSVVGCSVPIAMDYDRDKVVKILTNLLSNAFKHTPEGGSIVVEVERHGEESVELSVTDSGCGISDEDKRRIFDRFYQTKSAAQTSGTGIGLHIVKEFVTLHEGSIRVEDNHPQGARFVVTLPISRGAESAVEEGERMLEHTPDVVVSGGRQTVLVVDDNDDFREWLRSMLASEYEVLGAVNGREALRVLSRHDVDVVVSDVMMPVMDGIEFCRQLKGDINYSHIPVILLTARTMQDDEVAGLESGADDYVRKPFNMSILRLRIAKFMEWRRRAHAMFSEQLEIKPDEMTTTTIDDRLLKSAIDVVNSNIDNPNFSVADLSSALGMHRTHLYKKLSSLTGKSPLEFIRSIRLKRAAQLLERDRIYISEVAYMVGFNSPKLFARHFRDEFGVSPSEYRQSRNMGVEKE